MKYFYNGVRSQEYITEILKIKTIKTECQKSSCVITDFSNRDLYKKHSLELKKT